MSTPDELRTPDELWMEEALREAQRAHAQDFPPGPPDRISFGMVGIARGQTVRLNVANVAVPGDRYFPPDPCRVVLAFLNGDGEVLRTSDGQPVQLTVMVEHGHSAFLQISADSLLARGEVRLNFRPVVIVQAIVAATVLSIVASILPARRAGRISIVSALRSV